MTDHYRLTFENLPEATLTVASNGTVLRMNTAAERLFCISVEEVAGMPLETLMPEGRILLGHPVPQDRFTRIRLLISGIGLYGRRGTGEEFPINVRFSWFEDGAGTSVACVVTETQSWEPQ